MKTAEFEEREYEGFLYGQLQQGQHLWHPGQVLEQYLGFDYALFLEDPFLWNLHGIPNSYPGTRLSRHFWLRQSLRKGYNRLPTFRLNCFIQTKRPEYGRRLPRRLGALGSRRPFYKISIKSDQQATLAEIALKLAKHGLFVYAAPVFAQTRELFARGTAGTIVKHSSFPAVLRLKGHKAWYYNEPGAHGIANQEYTYYEDPSLLERIDAMLSEPEERSELSQSQNLEGLRLAIQEAVVVTAEQASQPRNAYLSSEWREIDRAAEMYELPPALTSYLYVEAFVRFFSLSWLTIG